MNKVAYIAVLLYLPLTVVYAQFCPQENVPLLWNKYFFLLDKLLIVALLITLIRKEVLRRRRLVYWATLGLILLFLSYLLLDWREVYNYNKVMVTLYCSLGILGYVIALIRYRHDDTNQR